MSILLRTLPMLVSSEHFLLPCERGNKAVCMQKPIMAVTGDETDEETELAPSHMAAATGDMPTYQIRAPTTALPQGVVMAASPGSLHSPQQLAEEATRKRELRLMKNSPQVPSAFLISSRPPSRRRRRERTCPERPRSSLWVRSLPSCNPIHYSYVSVRTKEVTRETVLLLKDFFTLTSYLKSLMDFLF
uniref:cAMP responsive element modulator n=1 Tax=Equus caballus TaxID=9796 RepID=A0A3Q2HC09_HORSE